jgi:hypothetical protein
MLLGAVSGPEQGARIIFDATNAGECSVEQLEMMRLFCRDNGAVQLEVELFNFASHST